MANTVELYNGISRALFAAGGFLGVVAVIMFFRYRIPHIIRWMLYEKGIGTVRTPSRAAEDAGSRGSGKKRKKRERKAGAHPASAPGGIPPAEDGEKTGKLSGPAARKHAAREGSPVLAEDPRGENATGLLSRKPSGRDAGRFASPEPGKTGFRVVRKVLISDDGKEVVR